METEQQTFLQPHHPQSEIKIAYENAKGALSGGLVKTKEQTNKEVRKTQVEADRLKVELEAYKRKEEQ